MKTIKKDKKPATEKTKTILAKPDVVAPEAEKRVRPPKRKLNTIDGVIYHLQWAMLQAERGFIDVKLLNGIAAAANVLSGLIIDFEHETRLRKLEEVANNAKA